MSWHYMMPGSLLGAFSHPARMPLVWLEGQKRLMGSPNFLSQFQQAPVPPEGNLVKLEWFKRYTNCPAGPARIIQSWDTAAKAGELNDYSVCTTWRVYGSDYYLVHVFRERLAYPDLKRKAIELAKRFRPHVILVEDKGHGTALVQDLRNIPNVPRPIGVLPEGDKISRMSAQSACIEAGQVWLPTRADWLSDFEAELLAFPRGRHDDQVDSVSQFLTWIRTPRYAIGMVRLRGF